MPKKDSAPKQRNIPGRWMMSVLQYNELPDINHIPESWSNDEIACIEAIREIVISHGLQDRLGLAVLHKHFDLLEGEVMVERCDYVNRTLVSKPMRHSEVLRKGITLTETIISFDGKTKMKCEKFCPKDDKGRHRGMKDHYTAD